ncbi:hypothetical protein FF011L_38310 [Roseimaritima multifibrata]|uniref:Cadherin domain-containing protein n=1 Tax=Roseimaritima multifibrata TaxID=1930274 RepID=A0A517MJT7_9BACT|nr:putative Ig domain-containing protein [Roseimaritima multifibrata]QDS95047.1 hypothetical protein FF011L_38310 [Roseimaritima multifibrata]
MTQRERFLAILVGGVLLLITLQWGINRFRTARADRDTEIARLTNEIETANNMNRLGFASREQMARFVERSLPSDPDRAVSEYSDWLLMLMEASGVTGSEVDSVNNSAFGDLYRVYNFRVSASGDMEKIVWLLHAFHRTDYLQRIRNMTIKPRGIGGDLQLSMSLEVLAMNEASPQQPPPSELSPLVDADVNNYLDPILDRNFFSPPNQSPRFAGEQNVKAILGETLKVSPKFEDPDGDTVSLELLGDIPEGITFNKSTGSIEWKPTELSSIKLRIAATDAGRPSRTVEQVLSVTVEEPPKEEMAKPASFDEASQAFLNALVYSKGSWEAWMTVRTRGEKLELRAGDEIEVGSVTGKVIDVTQRFIELEVDDRRFTLKLDDNLATAAREALVD